MRSRKVGHSTTDPLIRDFIRLRDYDTCQLCGKVYDKILSRILPHLFFSHMEIDHIIPYSFGGRNDIENYQLTCRQCNRAKSDTLQEV